jgi:F-type H+-transporting ATPase subunit b
MFGLRMRLGCAATVLRRLHKGCLVAGLLLGSGAVLTSGVALASAPHGDAHGDAHGEHALGEVNWFFGFLGEDPEIEEPTVLWRKPGMPVPLGAYLINSTILFALFYRFGKQPLLQALGQRRQAIMQGIDEAARMKQEAAGQLAHYEAKLARIDADIERIRAEMKESAEAERQRILEETRKRCARLEAEARALIVQELKAAKEGLHIEVVGAALRGAERLLSESVTAADHERLSDEYLGSLNEALSRSVGTARSGTLGSGTLGGGE